MLRYTGVRIAQAIPVLLLLACANFLLLRAAPGDIAAIRAGQEDTPEQLAAIRSSLGLDKSLFSQMLDWLGGVVHGDLGSSYNSAEPVTTVLAADIGPTFTLACAALVLIIGIGIPLGVVAALFKDRRADRAIRAVSLTWAAVPSLVLGVLLVLVFGWWFPGGLPFQGYVPFSDDPVESIRYLVLPAITAAALPIGIVIRMTRASVIEVLGQEYILAARAFGVPFRELIGRDVLGNALMPVLTIVGVLVGVLLSGTVLVENIFGIPGLGRALIGSFGQRDYPVAVGVTLVISVTFLAVNLLTDLTYGLLNPKIRSGYAGGRA